MFRKVITSALALLLMLTGLAAQEPVHVTSATGVAHAETLPGSVEDHRLDDLPMHLSPGLQDTPHPLALLTSNAAFVGPIGEPSAPQAALATLSPWLGTPHRPPRPG